MTESATAKKEKATSDDSFFAEKPYKISFEKSSRYFKPNDESVVTVFISLVHSYRRAK